MINFGAVNGGYVSEGETHVLRSAGSGADLLVQMDLDGNGVADMEIVLQGLAGQSMTAGDLLFV
jgi:hypothetical protein